VSGGVSKLGRGSRWGAGHDEAAVSKEGVVVRCVIICVFVFILANLLFDSAMYE
jgi:hypothetical protein